MNTWVKAIAFIGITLGAVYIYLTGVIQEVMLSLGTCSVVTTFLGGFFYSSGITTPLGVVIFASAVQELNPLVVAAFGALGAVIADGLLFSAVKKMAGRKICFEGHSIKIPVVKGGWQRILALVVGGVMLALPFPDEIPILLLGLEKERNTTFAVVVYLFKFLGILAVCESVLVL